MNLKYTSAAVTLSVALALTAFALDAKYQPIADAMKFAHKAPKGEKSVADKIIDGTVSEEDLKKTLELYKGMANTEPPKGDPAAFKQAVAKLIAATEDVVAKKDGAAAAYKEAVNCKKCHTDFRPAPEPKKP
jgi:cytochrome c556